MLVTPTPSLLQQVSSVYNIYVKVATYLTMGTSRNGEILVHLHSLSYCEYNAY